MDKPVERQKFYKAIKEVFVGDVEMTARECAVRLYNNGLVPYPTRQCVQPRLTEMCKYGWFETVGSKFDTTTQKTVTVYRSVNNGKGNC